MLGEPLPEWSVLVGGEVFGYQVDKTSGDGPLELLKQLYVTFGVPGAGSVGLSDLPSFTLRAPNTHTL